MKRVIPSLIALFALPGWAAVNVPLVVQETLYPGSVAGINRNSDPVTAGLPLPDDPVTGVTDVSQLTVTGASVGQFRVLGRWPSGRIKWVQVDTQASLTAGQKNTSLVLANGSGNFGGSNLATDNGATITVSTGAATFTIKKANFNGLDQVVVGGTTVVASGTSPGLVLMGPAPGQTTCPPCTTVYSSSNDAASTAVIEENGPAKTVIKATGSHVDSSGNAYMHFTVRLYFYKGKTAVKVNSILRNADYGTSNSFASAYKGHQGYELRITPQLNGAGSYSFGNHLGAPTTGTVSGTDSVYLYQGEAQQMRYQAWCGYGCVPYTSDAGYSIVKNGANLLTGTDTQYPEGWADIRDSSGAGMSIGVYQLAAYWPKSLEFNNGGSDVRIGIWARQNSQPYYQVWPQWSIHDLYLNFHAAADPAPSNGFLAFQHYLVARAAYTYYNSTGVFPYTLLDPATEDNFYTTTGASSNPATIPAANACCIQDFGLTIWNWPLHIFRYYAWGDPGGANQTEFRWSYLLNFITRGMTGRYLEAAHFYHFQAESFLPHADGFNWRDKPHVTQANAELDGFGFPSAASLNSDKAFRNWRDQEHGHWYGMTDFYFMTGDETIREAMIGQAKDWYLNPDTYQNGSAGGLWNSRSVGIELIGAARFAQFLSTIGDPDAANVLSMGSSTYNVQVKPDLCVSGYPAGCVSGAADGGPWNTQGVSRVRGVPWGANGAASPWCGKPHIYRVNSSFQPSILIQGLLEFRNAQGPAWADYWTALDLAYGISQWNLAEMFVDDGSGRWDTNGFRYGVALDVANNCPGESPADEYAISSIGAQTVSMPFLVKYLVEGNTAWSGKFQTNLRRLMYSGGTTTSDFGSYQVAHMVSILNKASSTTLNTVALSGVVDNGSGNYTISWTVPAGAQSYRIKWAPKRIVEWIGFDNGNNVFTGDAANTTAWFAANNATGIPAPAATGSVQSMTISTGVTGLTAANFSVKAYSTSGGGTVSVPANLAMVSGNGQSGTVGQTLANPLVVRVTDASGLASAGVAVTFAVAGGGGSVASASAVTDASGTASTLWTLGASAGTNTATASVAGLSGSPLTFTATGTAAVAVAAKLVLASGNNQTGTAGQPLGSALVVQVTDASGTPVSGTTVTFTVAAGGGSLSPLQAVSDSNGRASSSLTLGSSAGVNTVVASTAALPGITVTFTETATAVAPPGSPTITWTKQTPTSVWPGYNGFHTLWFDPLSRQTILYGIVQGSMDIYSTDIFFYNSSNNTWTRLGGDSSLKDYCAPDSATWPGDRHPGWNMTIDTKRNYLWLAGGVCSGVTPQDTYFLKLSANPMNAVWQRVTPAHFAFETKFSAMAYDPDDDVLFSFGYDGGPSAHNNWVYCRTAENPTPGTPTSKQLAAGCTLPDDWNEVAVTGGVQPLGTAYPGIVYDTVTKKVILYGGGTGGGIPQNQTWAYDVPTRTWTQKALSTTPPPVYSGSTAPQPAMAYNPATHTILYHQTSGAGAPADWQYDPSADTWSKLASVGGGAAIDQVLSYDPVTNRLIGFNIDSNYQAEVWQGALSGSGHVVNYDLNGDGSINVLDLELVIRQALGLDACTSGDLNGDGVCDSTDILWMINAIVNH